LTSSSLFFFLSILPMTRSPTLSVESKQKRFRLMFLRWQASLARGRQRIYLALFLSGLFQNPCAAQDPGVNLHKYWNYRQRLVDNFVLVGPQPGQSIPAGIRNLWNGAAIHYGDAPVYLGYYIGVLATEYALLDKGKQKTDRTLTELYYALEAINRLDERAEKLWGLPSQRNGFLLSNDVPLDFCQKYASWANAHAMPSQPGYGICGYVNNVQSGLDTLGKESNACSQDHLTCLLLGLALTKQFTADSILFNDELTGLYRLYSFKRSAIDIAGRILHYLRDKPFGGMSWSLRVPQGEKLNNVEGGNAHFNSFGFAQAGRYFNNQDYRNRATRLTHFYWKSFYRTPIFSRLHTDNLLFGLELSAIGQAWSTKTYSRIMSLGSYPASRIPGMWSANRYGWDLFYGSLFHLLHPENTEEPQLSPVQEMSAILNEAPFEGPYFHSATDKAGNGWAGSSGRFYDSPPNQTTGKLNFNGNYNGLDYMLFYNLYALLLNEEGTRVGNSVPYTITSDFHPGF
jgi:hypothetical protein